MNKQLPVISRLIQKKDLERSNEFLMHKLMGLKFSNISSLNSPPPDRRVPKARHIDLVKITISSDKKQRRVKTLLEGERIKQENKVLFSRLVNQKSTMQAKDLAEHRHKNVEYLKRIGRYPYTRVKSVANHLEPGNDSTPIKSEHRRYQTQYYHQEEDESYIYNVRTETQKSKNLNWQLGEEQKKDHLIVLFSKVIQISKNWFTVKVLRFKNHYQLKLQSYPYQKVEYSLKLPEDIGTVVLTQNDYDYLHICQRYIKMTHQYVCFSFQITAEERKKYFYRFQKRVLPATGQEKEEALSQVQEQRMEEESPTALRKTVFAVENEKKEKEQLEASQRKFKSNPNKEIQEKQSRLDISGSIDIRLSGILV